MPNNPRDFMANERTFLAWIRTSIGIMVFGFVLEKFSLLLKEFGEKGAHLHSSFFGIALVVLGLLICLLAFIKFRKVHRQLKADNYQPTTKLDFLLASLVLCIGALLVIFLLK